jgi:hypothetical protein
LLESYLKGVERVLRSGGWKDEEIDDMMAADPAPRRSDAAHLQLMMTRAEMRDAVAGNASAVFSSLRAAGWSAHEVAEILALGPADLLPGGPPADPAAAGAGVKPPKKAGGRAKLRDLLGDSIVPA